MGVKPCEYGCGAEVHFVLLLEAEDGMPRVWSPPMEQVIREVKRPRAKTFEYADIVVTQRFAVHECEGSKRAREEKSVREQQNHVRAKSRARQTKEAWKEALKRECPKCEQGPRDYCVNLTKAKKGEWVSINWPHAERLPEGFIEAQMEALKDLGVQ